MTSLSLKKNNIVKRLQKRTQQPRPQCLKITEKVSFNSASEASYVYKISGLKFIKNTHNGQKVLPDRSLLIGKKLVENAKIEKFLCDILGDFQTL